MARATLLLPLVFAAAVAHADAVPRVLVVQEMLPVANEVDPNVRMADYLASELDRSGLVSSVVWSVTDPIFRQAQLDGLVVGAGDTPSLNEALSTAGKMRAEYVVWIKASRSKGNVAALIRFYKGRKEAWKDEKNLNVSVAGQASEEDTAKTLATTWVTLMAQKPLKDLVAKPAIPTPELQPGQNPAGTKDPPPVTPPTKPPVKDPPKDPVKDPVKEGGTAPPPVTPPVKPPVDNTTLRKDVQSLMSSGRKSEAILRLRDAVDAEPANTERRLLLVETLTEIDPAQAATEARRSVGLMPQSNDLRIAAARAWMRAGRTKEAREDLNEAIARDPNAAPTRLMLAELNLTEGKTEAALDHVDAVLKAGENADARFLRALCRTALGGSEGAAQDLEESRKLADGNLPAGRYGLAVRVLQAATKRAIDDERSLMQRAMVKPGDAAVKEESERLLRLSRARTNLMTALTPPLGNRNSHERRLLAFRLIGQSLMDLQSYLGSRDEDVLSESRINLGEAIKHATAADEAFAKE